MSFSLLDIWAHMGFMSKLIAGILLVMGMSAGAIFVERLLALRKFVSESTKFAERAADHMNELDFAAVSTVASELDGSPLAVIVRLTVGTFVRESQRSTEALSPVELARREALRRLESFGANVRYGMTVVASVGSLAPFVGLLGTVVGIITAFQGIAATGSGGLGSVSAGISEALVETALGLCVAIPAVLFHNVLTSKVADLELNLNRSIGELIDDLENYHVRQIVRQPNIRQAT